MSLDTRQVNTLMMSKLYELELLMSRKLLQDPYNERVAVIHTRMYETIVEMEECMLDIMQQDEIECDARTFQTTTTPSTSTTTMSSESEYLNGNPQPSSQHLQHEESITSPNSEPSIASAPVYIRRNDDGTATCLSCNANCNWHTHHLCEY